jgi:hypothetical protein
MCDENIPDYVFDFYNQRTEDTKQPIPIYTKIISSERYA